MSSIFKVPPKFSKFAFFIFGEFISRVINVCFHSFAQFYHCFLSRGFTFFLASSEVREEMEMATHSSILAWKIPWRSPVGYSPWGRKESDTIE